jgi:hypothetical protein
LINVLRRSALTGIAGLVVAAAASAAAAPTPSLPAFDGAPSKDNPSVKPNQIVYAGDSSGFFAGAGKKKAGNLDWSVWNSTEALASGENWINNCTPNCAKGTFLQFPVSLKAYRPKKESKYLIFTRLKVTYTGKKPGNQKTVTWTVSYSKGTFLIG